MTGETELLRLFRRHQQIDYLDHDRFAFRILLEILPRGKHLDVL